MEKEKVALSLYGLRKGETIRITTKTNLEVLCRIVTQSCRHSKSGLADFVGMFLNRNDQPRPGLTNDVHESALLAIVKNKLNISSLQ